jgi:drug/metabolite transporter (DMT)-like permease
VQRRNNLRGMAFSVASGLVLVGSFGMARHVSEELHPFEVTFLRSFFGLIFLAPWLFRFGLKSFRTARLSIHIIRSVFHVGASLTFFFALTIAPFAELTALYFISPVFVTIMAVIFFVKLWELDVGPPCSLVF